MIPEYYVVVTFILGSVFGYILRERTGWVNIMRMARRHPPYRAFMELMEPYDPYKQSEEVKE